MAKRKYKVGFTGVYSSRKDIFAESEKEAKQLFADMNNIIVSPYIKVWRK